MALSDKAQEKALEFVEGIYEQSQPDTNTSTGSAIRSLMMIPFSAAYAAIFQEMDAVRRMFLGNYSSLTQAEMDRLGEEHFVNRPEGSRSTTQLEIYLSEAEAFTLRAYPYFSSQGGTNYRPITQTKFELGDIVEKDGELLVRVPVISENYGPASEANADEITNFENLPVDVTRVTNPEPTQGGAPRVSNSEYFQLLQNAQNDNGIDQANGLLEHISQLYSSVLTGEVVQAGDDRMMRGEVWTEDGQNPIRERKGKPFAEHTDLQNLDFDSFHGRVKGYSSFDEEDEGKRVMVENDPTHFWRTIRKVKSNDEIILSGPNLTGVRNATMLEEGPNIRDVSDVYLQIPALEVESTIIDNSFVLESTEDVQKGDFTFSYTIPEGFGYDTIPDTGRLVIGEGTSSEEIRVVQSTSGDIRLENSVQQQIPKGATVKLYNMEEIGADQLNRPVIYILRIDEIDPTSREVGVQIPRSSFGKYHPPGWYWEQNDPPTIFSPKEKKKIRLDDKRDQNRNIEGATFEVDRVIDQFIGPTYDYHRIDLTPVISNIDFDFDGMEGRNFTLRFPNHKLSNDGVEDAVAIREQSDQKLRVDSLNAEYFTEKGYRDRGVQVELKDASDGSTIDVYTDAYVREDEVYRFGGKEFDSQDTANNYLVDVILFGEWRLHDEYSFMGEDIEGWVVRPIDSDNDGVKESADIRLAPTSANSDGDLSVVADETGIFLQGNITIQDEFGDIQSSPARIIYATHSDIRDLQTTLDNGQQRLLCDDILARSMRPTLIDASITYHGDSSPDTVRQEFINLVSEAVRNHPDDDVRLDISNVIARLDEEGFADWFDLDPEIRVTNFLEDGTREIRYLNPAPETKQEVALSNDIAANSNKYTLTVQQTEALLPGRGTLYLGGNDPNRQEIVPYEAAIENDNGTVTFILREGWELEHEHHKWESVYVTTRDYDPDLEFEGQSILLPAENRPYVRQLIIQRQ